MSSSFSAGSWLSRRCSLRLGCAGVNCSRPRRAHGAGGNAGDPFNAIAFRRRRLRLLHHAAPPPACAIPAPIFRRRPSSTGRRRRGAPQLFGGPASGGAAGRAVPRRAGDRRALPRGTGCSPRFPREGARRARTSSSSAPRREDQTNDLVVYTDEPDLDDAEGHRGSRARRCLALEADHRHGARREPGGRRAQRRARHELALTSMIAPVSDVGHDGLLVDSGHDQRAAQGWNGDTILSGF